MKPRFLILLTAPFILVPLFLNPGGAVATPREIPTWERLNFEGVQAARLGQWEKAISLFDRGIAAAQKLNQQLPIGILLNNLADAMNVAGKPEQVEKCLLALVKHELATAGSDHLLAVVAGPALSKLANFYETQNSFEKAEKTWLQLCKLQIEGTSEDDIVVNNFRRQLADFYYRTGRLDKAETVLSEIVNQQKTSTGGCANIRELLFSLILLGEVLCSSEHFERANEVFIKAELLTASNSKMFGAEQFIITLRREALKLLLNQQSSLSNSQQIVQDIRTRYRTSNRQSKTRNEMILQSAAFLAHACQERKLMQQSEHLYSDVVAQSSTVFPSSIQRTVLVRYVDVLYEVGKKNQAIDLENRFKEKYNESAFEIHYWRAERLFWREQWIAGLEMAKLACADSVSEKKDSSASVYASVRHANALRLLAGYYGHLSDYRHAEAAAEKALVIQQKELSKNIPDSILQYLQMAAIKNALGKKEECRKMYQRGLNVELKNVADVKQGRRECAELYAQELDLTNQPAAAKQIRDALRNQQVNRAEDSAD